MHYASMATEDLRREARKSEEAAWELTERERQEREDYEQRLAWAAWNVWFKRALFIIILAALAIVAGVL